MVRGAIGRRARLERRRAPARDLHDMQTTAQDVAAGDAAKNAHGAVGVVGGVGPYAGLDLMRKLFDLTEARRDQEHLPVIAFSLPGEIADRTAFLLDESDVNPGEAIGRIMVRLARAGASVIGMPCNTAHSPRILEPALRLLKDGGLDARFVHMIDATMGAVAEALAATPAGGAGVAANVGVLSTKGTYATGVYQQALTRAGFTPLFPDEAGRDRVQAAISDPTFGIKAQSSPVTETARTILADEVARLEKRGARAVVLGCTEIPLALTEPTLCGIPLVDATSALARALITAFAPDRLRRPA